MSDRSCAVEGCDRKYYGRGWCQLHYKRVWKSGSPDPRPAFVPKSCLVDDCERRANVPGSARGFCGPHYQRYQRWGDPMGKHQPVVGIAECAVADCASLVKARGWCDLHWDRWYRHGTPTPRLRGEVVNGCRICPGCDTDLPLAAYGRSRSYCKPCTAERTREYRLANPPARVVGSPAICRKCGKNFLANKRRSTYCQRECFEADRYRADWKNQANRRARLASVTTEKFTREEIFDRDGWICQICGAPVDPGAPRYSYKVPSIDHIIPISRGGPHSRTNVQTACLGCNVRKGVSVA